MVRASRLAWISLFVWMTCSATNLILRQVLPTMTPGPLRGILWLLTDLNRLLVLAAMVGLVISAIWALRHRVSR